MMRALILLMIFVLSACDEQTQLPPVEELAWKSTNPNQLRHIVRRGETIHTVAFHYDKDYRQLAAYNQLQAPYHLRAGQVLYLQYPNTPRAIQPKPAARNVYLPPAPQVKPQYPSYSRRESSAAAWSWPVKGRVVANFIPQQGKKGIDIAANKGDLVRAAANGVVAYAGSGLAGYGNLIILKHDGQYLTAYGNNARNRVIEGQRVKVGQVIAEIGIVDRKFWGVHFEIRKAGQPVNPLTYLH